MTSLTHFRPILHPSANPTDKADAEADGANDLPIILGTMNALGCRHRMVKEAHYSDKTRKGRDELPPYGHVALPCDAHLAVARRTYLLVRRYLSLAIRTLYQRHISLLDKFALFTLAFAD